MSFFGNISNEGKTLLTFDKIYSTRKAMDESLLDDKYMDDSVFIGRYVLVKYDGSRQENNENYHKCWEIDKEAYKDENKNGAVTYDGTVWQKVIKDGKPTYELIGDLNAPVPTFETKVIPPSAEGGKIILPSFEKEEWADLIFTYKVQDNWRFAIGNIDFNQDGFRPESRNYTDVPVEDNYIRTDDKSSGAYEEEYGEGINDTKELSIYLPAIGDTICKVWDIVYGENRINKLDWGNTEGDRLVTPTGSGYTYEPNKVNTLAGCINSAHDLLGMIIADGTKKEDIANADYKHIYYLALDGIHNRYYMKDKKIEYLSEIIHPDTGKVYNLNNLTLEELNEIRDIQNKENLIDFVPNTYHTKDNNKYINAGSVEEGHPYFDTNYYNLNNEAHKLEIENVWEPNKYYYLENKNYILDISEVPDDNKDYYTISEEIVVGVDVNIDEYPMGTHFFVGQSAIENDGKKTGYFYLDADGNIQSLKNNDIYDSGLEYYYIENYEEKEENGYQNPNMAIYINDQKLEIEEIKEKYSVKFIEYEKNTYYKKENNNYILLVDDSLTLENNKIDSYTLEAIMVAEDISKGQEITKRLYTPNRYFSQQSNGDGFDYILESKALNNKAAYFVFGNYSSSEKKYIDIQPISERFYEPNVYYYKADSGEHVLSTSPTMDNETEYYSLTLVAVKEDSREITNKINPGKIWTENALPPEGVKLGVVNEVAAWKELEGFSRDINTLNGMILKLNQFCKFDDLDTRDTKTIQGALNSINDKINELKTLNPGEVVVVNQHGLLDSATLENITLDGKEENTLKERLDNIDKEIAELIKRVEALEKA